MRIAGLVLGIAGVTLIAQPTAASVPLAGVGALTVTYLVPLFAMLWGARLLGEALTLPMLAGALLVIVGTVLVLRG